MRTFSDEGADRAQDGSRGNAPNWINLVVVVALPEDRIPMPVMAHSRFLDAAILPTRPGNRSVAGALRLTERPGLAD